jgi:hypothetical protein
MVDNDLNQTQDENYNNDVPKYEDMIVLEPEKEVKLDVYAPPVKTIDEEEEESIQKTDKQAILRALRPHYKDHEMNEILQSAMSSRIFPDNFTDKHFLITASYIEKHIYDKDFNPMFAVSMFQDGLSIGFEGRHIADLLELAGAETSEELDKLSKSLGL